MALINTISLEAAKGQTRKIYDIMLNNVGVVPSPMQLSSVSPNVINTLWESIKYYSRHPALNFATLSTIRFLVAEHLNFAYCTAFNKDALKRQGLDDETIDAMTADPLKAPLEDKEQALVAFVVRAIKDPDAIGQEDVDRLCEMGWTDRDLLDAMVHGTNMVAYSILMKTFKMDFACQPVD